MRKVVGAAVAVAMLAGAPAGAACWSPEQTAAARIRDLQSQLMVSTLKCQVIHVDLTKEYNAFVGGNRTVIGTINTRLKTFFIRGEGPVGGQSAYDRFTTSLANAYGASKTNSTTCEEARALATEAAMMANSEEGLLLLADRAGIAPRLPGGRCETMASAGASAGTSAVVTAAK
ncbi:hypothetical protein [Sphingomonas crocodyli]|uniref:Excinuclease ABC subunit B n=1 Tax=Sphingomonas crocodyli TaxID=1979270 RepID=A0A437M6F7_9SPHN|nr:hypothetical protein [Sphingomonas crocodyli]RVT93084.1 hypothetical protein EOD43_04070 [Sphingomonas crocodyli]